MNIAPIQNPNYKQNTPSFKMNIKFADKITENAVNADFTSFWGKCCPEAKLSHFGTEKFDFNTYWKNFQDAFRNMTRVQNDEGLNNSTVDVCLDKIEKSYRDLTWIKYKYTDENGVTHKIENHDLPTNSLLKDSLFDKNRPFSSATRGVLATIADAIAHSGVGYGKENKVSKIINDLRNNDFSIDPNDTKRNQMNIAPIQNNNSNNYSFKRADTDWFNKFKPEKSAYSDIIDEIVRNIQKKYNNDPNDITKFCTVTRENGEKIG